MAHKAAASTKLQTLTRYEQRAFNLLALLVQKDKTLTRYVQRAACPAWINGTSHAFDLIPMTQVLTNPTKRVLCCSIRWLSRSCSRSCLSSPPLLLSSSPLAPCLASRLPEIVSSPLHFSRSCCRSWRTCSPASRLPLRPSLSFSFHFFSSFISTAAAVSLASAPLSVAVCLPLSSVLQRPLSSRLCISSVQATPFRSAPCLLVYTSVLCLPCILSASPVFLCVSSL